VTTFHVVNFGCRATQADAAEIEQGLLASGCVPTERIADAQLVVVNTCTVTAAADAEARQAIAALHKQNPAARIAVTGCYAQRAPQDLAPLPGVRWIVGNSHQQEIAQLCSDGGELEAGTTAIVPVAALSSSSLLRRPAAVLRGDIFDLRDVARPQAFGGVRGHTRPTLKIQDGCNHRCAYCVIPFVRGRSRSLAPGMVLEAIRQSVRAGVQEMVLSGINLGSYGQDLAPRTALVALLRRILDETELPRLRLSSLEPMDVTRELIEFIASTERMARHLHLPLQSGSDRVLAAMRRRYRRAHYAAHVALVRKLLPEAAIGADVIAGFPGESDADHRATLEFIEQLACSYVHVFSFSARPGTAAAALPESVVASVIRTRARELRALAEGKRAQFHAQQMGKRMRVLTLETNSQKLASGTTRAVSSNALDLLVEGRWPANHWLDVEIASVAGNRLLARPVAASAFKNDLGQRGVLAVGNAEGNVDDSQPTSKFLRTPAQLERRLAAGQAHDF
jgi:threonylcarbamoyladenosine tRNA methylthiotransferase MtaB